MSQNQAAFLPHNSEVGEIYKLNICFIVATCAIIGLRLFVRAYLVKHITVDDYLMVAAGIFSTAFSTMAIVGIRYGFGRHIWDLPQDVNLISRTKKAVQTLWICQFMYATALALVKLSIISSYLRVFPTKMFRRIMYGLAVPIVMVWICSIVVTILMCRPIRGAWDFTLPRKCLAIEDFYYFTTSFSIFTDFLLCTLPVPVFWRLKLPRRQKYIVSLLFMLGLFATVASALRISVLHDVNSLDVTAGSISTMNWSVVEVGTGVICACIPCLKPLFNNVFPDKQSTGSSRSGAGSSISGATQTRKPMVAEEDHELTKAPHDGWSLWARQDSHVKVIPVVTKQFV